MYMPVFIGIDSTGVPCWPFLACKKWHKRMMSSFVLLCWRRNRCLKEKVYRILSAQLNSGGTHGFLLWCAKNNPLGEWQLSIEYVPIGAWEACTMMSWSLRCLLLWKCSCALFVETIHHDRIFPAMKQWGGVMKLYLHHACDKWQKGMVYWSRIWL